MSPADMEEPGRGRGDDRGGRSRPGLKDQPASGKGGGPRNGEALRLAVVGAAAWLERYHLPAARALRDEQGLSLHGIWNRTPEKSRRLADEFDIPRVYDSLPELVRDGDLDGVVVVVSKHAVADILREVGAAGLPMLTEKPPGENTEQAEALERELAGSPCLVAFNRRYVPLHSRFRELLSSYRGLHCLECNVFRRERNDPSFVIETAIHGVDFLEYVAGPARHVGAYSRPVSASETYSTVALLHFPHDVTGVVKFFPYSGRSVETYEAHARDAWLRLSSGQHYTDEARSQIELWRAGASDTPEQERMSEDRDDPLVTSGYLEVYREFAGVIRQECEPRSDIRSAAHSMRVAEVIARGETRSLE